MDLGIYFVLFVALIVAGAFIYFYLQSRGQPTARGTLPNFSRVFILLAAPLTPVVKGVLKGSGWHAKSRWGLFIRQKRDAAGIYEVDEEDIMAHQVILGLFFFVIFVSVVKNPLIAAPLLLIGWGYPIALMNGVADERKLVMFAELPYVLDLLSLGIEAGLDFRSSVERLVNFSEPSPLMSELKSLLTDLQLGTPMQDALLKMRNRIDILAFFTFIEALIQATQIGIDVSSTLRAQSEQMRVTYFQNVEKDANSIPIEILLPSILCIFPPLILVVLGPIVMELSNHPAFTGARK
jgi:tight adherence protein C